MTQHHSESAPSDGHAPAAATPPEAAASPATPPARRRGKRRGKGGAARTTPVEASTPAAGAGNSQPRPLHPLLERLASDYPALFGAQPLPLKRGIFNDLLQAHPDIAQEELKQALAQHTRSTRYLQSMASGQPRHDLASQAVEPVAVEHGFHALVEIFQRRQQHGRATAERQAQARDWLLRRLQQHIHAANLDTQAYQEAVQVRHPTVQAILAEALQQADARNARDEALAHIFESSQTSVEAFAEMYGLNLQEARRVARRATSAPAASPSDTSGTQGE